MNADYESAGDGTFTVITGKVVTSNKSDVTITAWDMDLDGSLSSGTLTISAVSYTHLTLPTILLV